MPAPPMPWIVRPVRRVVKDWERAQIIEPVRKARREGMRSSRRPKMVLRLEIVGWRTAWARR